MYLNRPITPHLTVFKPQYSSLLSIWHRITGLSLIINGLFLIFCIKINQNLLLFFIYKIYIYSLKYIYILLLYYHIFNGIRNICVNFNYITHKKFLLINIYIYIFFIFIVFNLILSN